VPPDPLHASDPWRLDPSRFPRSVDLELSPEAYATLQAMSERRGRSMREIAAEILQQALDRPMS